MAHRVSPRIRLHSLFVVVPLTGRANGPTMPYVPIVR